MSAMQSFQHTGGRRPYFTDAQFERICASELRAMDLYPDAPSPVRIDRFVEKRFGLTPIFDDLPQGVLGYTEFDSTGPAAIYVSRSLSEEGTRTSERRVTSTLAHEAGHALLHAPLFAADPEQAVQLFEHHTDVTSSRIMCRDAGRQAYDGHWWELQANRVMACLMLPKELVHLALEELRVRRGALGIPVLEDEQRARAARLVSETFDVSLQAAQIRLDVLVPTLGNQLTL